MTNITEYWLTIAVIVFLTAMVLYGHYRGFLRMCVSAAAMLITSWAAREGTPYVCRFLRENTGLYDRIEEGIVHAVGIGNIPEVVEPAAQRTLIEGLRLPGTLIEALLNNNNGEIYRLLGVESFSGYIGRYLASSAVNMLVFLALFLLGFVFLRIIIVSLDIITRLPVIHGINQILGAVLGGAMGLFVVWALLLLAAALSTTPAGQAVTEQIAKSPVLRFLEGKNILTQLALAIMKRLG